MQIALQNTSKQTKRTRNRQKRTSQDEKGDKKISKKYYMGTLVE